jgi:hypothetical protein
VLKWLRKDNIPPCPWNEDTCSNAAYGGHLRVLKWLREENDRSRQLLFVILLLKKVICMC